MILVVQMGDHGEVDQAPPSAVSKVRSTSPSGVVNTTGLDVGGCPLAVRCSVYVSPNTRAVAIEPALTPT